MYIFEAFLTAAPPFTLPSSEARSTSIARSLISCRWRPEIWMSESAVLEVLVYEIWVSSCVFRVCSTPRALAHLQDEGRSNTHVDSVQRTSFM